MNAVFFDMDGTLIDSRADLAATVNHTRRDFGLAELSQEDVLRHVGYGARHLLRNAIPERASEEDALWENFRGHYSEHMLESVQLYPTVRTTLLELRDRGWKLGINTSKPAFATRAVLDHFGLTRLFEGAIVAGGDCDEMKPSAKPLRQCAALMRGHRLSSGDWMVGDSAADLLCARNAGVKGAFCSFGFGNAGDAPYTLKINRMEELLRHLKSEER